MAKQRVKKGVDETVKKKKGQALNVSLSDAAFDKEGGGGGRLLKGRLQVVVNVAALLLGAFAIFVNAFTNTQEIYRNALFLMFLFVLAFLFYPARKRNQQTKASIADWSFLLLGVLGTLYICIYYTDLHVVRSSKAILQDYVFATITLVVLLEASRRTIGLFIPLLGLVAVVYAMFGPYFPDLISHGGFSFERLLYRVYMTTEGIFGMTLSIASTYIIMFILFGAFLKESGASQLFNELAMAIAGKRRGGPAQVAVLSSALTGSLNGSAVANVATTGTFTIPLMKNIGLKPHFAAAVEAAASTGGMITPPIMGAAAFIMAGFLGIPYGTIILAAIIPTILYYAGLIIMIDLEAKKQGLKGISKDSLPRVWEVLKARGALLLPIVVVLVSLLAGKTPLFAGYVGIATTVIASWLTKDKSNRITPKKVATALVDGAKGTLQVGIACAVIGIIIAVVSMTGLGSVIAYHVVSISGGILWLILLLVMLTCIVLSMGLPSTALYIVVAVTAAPSLIEAGVLPLAAHFFVFWFGALSNITPPVALASYTGAGIAGANVMRTAWTALKLTLPGFIIPFMIAYNPIMVMQGDEVGLMKAFNVAVTLITGVLGVFALSIVVSNFYATRLNWVERIGFGFSALFLIKPGFMTDMIGASVLLALYVLHSWRAKREREVNLVTGT